MNRQLLKVYSSLKASDVESWQNTNNPLYVQSTSQFPKKSYPESYPILHFVRGSGLSIVCSIYKRKWL